MKPVAEAAGTGFATGKKESETIIARPRFNPVQIYGSSARNAARAYSFMPVVSAWLIYETIDIWYHCCVT